MAEVINANYDLKGFENNEDWKSANNAVKDAEKTLTNDIKVKGDQALVDIGALRIVLYNAMISYLFLAEVIQRSVKWIRAVLCPVGFTKAELAVLPLFPGELKADVKPAEPKKTPETPAVGKKPDIVYPKAALIDKKKEIPTLLCDVNKKYVTTIMTGLKINTFDHKSIKSAYNTHITDAVNELKVLKLYNLLYVNLDKLTVDTFLAIKLNKNIAICHHLAAAFKDNRITMTESKITDILINGITPASIINNIKKSYMGKDNKKAHSHFNRLLNIAIISTICSNYEFNNIFKSIIRIFTQYVLPNIKSDNLQYKNAINECIIPATLNTIYILRMVEIFKSDKIPFMKGNGIKYDATSKQLQWHDCNVVCGDPIKLQRKDGVEIPCKNLNVLLSLFMSNMQIFYSKKYEYFSPSALYEIIHEVLNNDITLDNYRHVFAQISELLGIGICINVLMPSRDKQEVREGTPIHDNIECSIYMIIDSGNLLFPTVCNKLEYFENYEKNNSAATPEVVVNQMSLRNTQYKTLSDAE